MKSLPKLALSIALIVVPAVFVFKSLFMPGHLAWGDAPFFYQTGLKQLISEPLAWTNRGINFGGVNNLIFIWPLMFLYGIIGSNDLAIRLLFYFPAIASSVIGTLLLAKYIKLPKVAQFFTVFIYLLNTYFILVVDGGQVGFALAYGIFPLTLYFLKKFFDRPSLNSFYLAVVFTFLLGVADPRVAIISLVTVLLWQMVEFKFRMLIYLVPLSVVVTLLGMYWIYPLITNNVSSGAAANSAILKWYYPLTLYSPNWPDNLFGKISRPPLYFFGVTFLALIGSLKQKRIAVLFIIFAVFTLGVIPFGNLPFGYAFRDSTKFFIPLVLFGGILVGSAVSKFDHWITRVLVYIFVLFLVSPALLGKMNFVLGERRQPSDPEKINQFLMSDGSFYRSAWLPEKFPVNYETSDQPTLDAKDLTNSAPFASLNASEDTFNFLNNASFAKWFKVLGIKYLIMSGSPRELGKNEKEQKDWNTITGLVDKNKDFEKLNLGTNTPVYKLKNETYPRFYSVDRLTLVVGPMITSGDPVPAVYAEDGKWDPSFLQGKNKDSVKIFLNGGSKEDLAMSFLQKYFVAASEANEKQWAIYTKDEYLKYKYELLIRDFKYSDFDYQKGIAFSTKKGEALKFNLKVPEDGEYVIAVRKSDSKKQKLSWSAENKTLKKGILEYQVINGSEMEVLNVVALVPKSEYQKANKLAEVYLAYFGALKQGQLAKEKISEVQVEKPGTLKYKFSAPAKSYWLIFTDNYHPLWQLRRGIEYTASFPVYSAINGFYVEPKWVDLGIEFRGQENVRWGMYVTAISGLVLTILYLWLKSDAKKN